MQICFDVFNEVSTANVVRHKDLQGISIVLYVSLRSRLKPTASNTNMTPESKGNTDSFLEVESEDERIKRIGKFPFAFVFPQMRKRGKEKVERVAKA